MSIHFAETVRGNQRIFTRVLAEGEGADDPRAWRAHALTAEGLPMPARIVAAPDGVQGVVLVLLVSPRDQVAHVSLGDESASLAVGARWARVQSQLNTLTRNAAAMAIRNCDEALPEGDRSFVVRVQELIRDGDQDIARIEVSLRSDGRDALGGAVEVRLQDREGRSVKLGDTVVMGDATAADPDYPGVYRRTLATSTRIPSDTAELVVWASVESQVLGEAFVLLDAARMQGLREDHYWATLSAERDPAYDSWFRDTHRARPWQLEEQRRTRFPLEPTFSIVVPLFETPLVYFREMADSVLAQTYGRFELVLVNASPTNTELAAEVERYRELDDRVKVVPLGENRGIASNTRAGVEACAGDFVAFLDHDDVLEPDLLYHYARGVNAYPTTDLLYCDEDKLVEDGQGVRRFEQVFFKPDWSPDLLRSQNYVSHLLCVRRSVLQGLGPSDRQYEGAQDHDLALRVGEVARNVYHARRCMYHWRVHAGSTAASPREKDYTTTAGVRAVQAQLDRLGIDGQAYAEDGIPNLYHVRYRFGEGHEPLVSIVIPNKDAVGLLSGCLRSIRERTTYGNYEIVVVENGSEDEETFECYRRASVADERVRIVTYVPKEPGFNFARIMNYGISQVRGEYVLMLNNDTEVISPDWIESLLGHAMEPGVGCVGAKLLYPDGTIQHAGVCMFGEGPGHISQSRPGDTTDYFRAAQTTRDFLAVTGACLMVRRSLFDELGGIDETFAVDYNDVDLCLRSHRAGYRNVYEPKSVLRHYESVSRGKNDSPAKALRYRRERGLLQERWPRCYELSDPYMNPNLCRGRRYFYMYWHLDNI